MNCNSIILVNGQMIKCCFMGKKGGTNIHIIEKLFNSYILMNDMQDKMIHLKATVRTKIKVNSIKNKLRISKEI